MRRIKRARAAWAACLAAWLAAWNSGPSSILVTDLGLGKVSFGSIGIGNVAAASINGAPSLTIVRAPGPGRRTS